MEKHIIKKWLIRILKDQVFEGSQMFFHRYYLILLTGQKYKLKRKEKEIKTKIISKLIKI